MQVLIGIIPPGPTNNVHTVRYVHFLLELGPVQPFTVVSFASHRIVAAWCLPEDLFLQNTINYLGSWVCILVSTCYGPCRMFLILSDSTQFELYLYVHILDKRCRHWFLPILHTSVPFRIHSRTMSPFSKSSSLLDVPLSLFPIRDLICGVP